MSGTLYICATPIGNLEDISLRVLRVLREADVIAAEDTRTSQHLLAKYEITTPLTSYHKFNENEKGPYLTDKLLAGENIALISDAGTPAISDPGEILVRRCLDLGIPVTSVPGASACITALTLSGRSTRRFVFEGFLPAEKQERTRVLSSLENETRTIVCYEAPHRVKKTLKELAGVLGEGREITLCRELTKKFETVIRTTIGEAIGMYEAKEPRGEYVFVIAGLSHEALAQKEADRWAEVSIPGHVAMYEAQGLPHKEAMRQAAKDRGLKRQDVYKALLSEK